jgi:hypothetical protein
MILIWESCSPTWFAATSCSATENHGICARAQFSRAADNLNTAEQTASFPHQAARLANVTRAMDAPRASSFQRDVQHTVEVTRQLNVRGMQNHTRPRPNLPRKAPTPGRHSGVPGVWISVLRPAGCRRRSGGRPRSRLGGVVLELLDDGATARYACSCRLSTHPSEGRGPCRLLETATATTHLAQARDNW